MIEVNNFRYNLAFTKHTINHHYECGVHCECVDVLMTEHMNVAVVVELVMTGAVELDQVDGHVPAGGAPCECTAHRHGMLVEQSDPTGLH